LRRVSADVSPDAAIRYIIESPGEFDQSHYAAIEGRIKQADAS
jgi:hypothetical protein